MCLIVVPGSRGDGRPRKGRARHARQTQRALKSADAHEQLGAIPHRVIEDALNPPRTVAGPRRQCAERRFVIGSEDAARERHHMGRNYREPIDPPPQYLADRITARRMG